MEKETQNQPNHQNPDGSKVGKITKSQVDPGCMVQANCTIHHSTLSGEVQVRNSANIQGSRILRRASIQGHSDIHSSTITDDARISGHSSIRGATVKNHARIHGSNVYGIVAENAYVDGDSLVDAHSIIRGNAYICNIFMYHCTFEGDVSLKKRTKVMIRFIHWWRDIP